MLHFEKVTRANAVGCKIITRFSILQRHLDFSKSHGTCLPNNKDFYDFPAWLSKTSCSSVLKPGCFEVGSFCASAVVAKMRINECSSRWTEQIDLAKKMQRKDLCQVNSKWL